jgi:hypothetical protein
MASYVKDTDSFEVYDGSGWVPVSVDAAWVTAGTAGQILISNGTADPSWVAAETTLAAGSAGALVQSAGTAGVTYSAVGTEGFTALSAGTAGISYQPVSHNYIINGAFDIWQRGTSFSNPATLSFVADRWAYRRANANVTDFSISQQAFTAGELEAAGFGSNNFYLRIACVTANISNYRITQKLEDVRSLAGQTVTLSYYAKSSVSNNTQAFAIQNFGSGGSTDVAINGTGKSLTTSWQRFEEVFELPSVAGKTIGANSYLEIRLGVNSPEDGSTFDIWGVQLEAGSVATPFKRNAPSLGLEELACKRYYQEIATDTLITPVASGATVASTIARISLPLVTPMRANPTVVSSGTVSIAVANGTSFTPSGISNILQMGNVLRIQYAISGATSGLPCTVIYTSGSITLTAELT